MRALLWILAAGCTGTIGSMGGDDDQPPPPPPPPGNVQIVVQDGATPQAGVRVLFQNADGSTLSEVMTDAAGHAQADMPSGGNLTVIRTYPATTATPRLPEALTYVGVKAGDRLVLGHESDLGGAPTTINVMLPQNTQGNVTVVTPCGTGTGTAPMVPVTVTGCPAQLPVYLIDDNRQSVFAMMPYSAMIDLSHQSLVGTLNETESAINLQPGTAVTVEQRLMVGAFELYRSDPRRIDGGPQNVDLPNLQGVDELLVATLQPQAGGTEMVAGRKPYAVTPTIIDATAGVIPYIAMPAFTPTSLTWTETGPGTADAVVVTLAVTPQSGSGYVRQILAPHGGMSLAIPQLIGADAIYNAAMMDQVQGSYGLAQMTGGYDAMRTHAFSVASVIELAPGAGTAVLSYAGNTAPGM